MFSFPYIPKHHCGILFKAHTTYLLQQSYKWSHDVFSDHIIANFKSSAGTEVSATKPNLSHISLQSHVYPTSIKVSQGKDKSQHSNDENGAIQNDPNVSESFEKLFCCRMGEKKKILNGKTSLETRMRNTRFDLAHLCRSGSFQSLHKEKGQKL